MWTGKCFKAKSFYRSRNDICLYLIWKRRGVAEDDTYDELHSDVDEEQEEEKDEATDEIRLTNSSPMNNSIRAPLSIISEQVTSSSDNFVQNMTPFQPFIFKDNSSNRGKRGTGAQVIGDSLCKCYRQLWWPVIKRIAFTIKRGSSKQFNKRHSSN